MGAGSKGAARGNGRPTARNTRRAPARRPSAPRRGTPARAGAIRQLQQQAGSRETLGQRIRRVARQAAARVRSTASNLRNRRQA